MRSGIAHVCGAAARHGRPAGLPILLAAIPAAALLLRGRGVRFALLLFCCFLLPAVSQAAPPACGDFLAEIGAKPAHLEFVECKPSRDAQLAVLEARYRVAGAHAAEVEKYFVDTAHMGRLEFHCCGWESWSPSGGSLAHNRPLAEEGPTEPNLDISMGSGESLISNRDRWAEIPWFYVDVLMYLESP